MVTRLTGAAQRAGEFVSKAALLTAAKVLVSAGLLVWIIRRIGFADQSMVLSAGEWRFLGLVWLLQSILPIVQAQRWRMIAERLGSRLPFRAAVANIYIGQFFNQVLPSSLGGDAARVWKLTRVMSLETALTSVAFDRIVAMLAVPLIMMIGSGILVRLEPSGPFRWTMLAIMAVMAFGLVLLFCADRIPLPAVLRRSPAVEFLRSIPRAARRLFSDPGCLVRALILSMLIHAGVGTSLWILALANSVDVPLAVFLVLAPLIMAVTTIPISVGGWGLREGAAVAVLSLVDVPPPISLAISVQFGLVMLVVGLPGGVITLLGSMRRQEADTRPSALEPRFDSREVALGAD